jgi:pilus assembly protein CpaD
MLTTATTVPAFHATLLQRMRQLCILIALAPLCGCGVDRTVTSSIADEDYRVRHPLVLTDQAISLDIFPEGSKLGPSSRARIREFAAKYKNVGEGPVTILLPEGTGHDEIARNSLGAIRESLAAGGLRTPVDVGVYPVPDPKLASPVRLSFVGLKAKVASQCGQWPDNLASGALGDGWENHPYWNQGCAYQSAFAAQVADPRDLVTPRAEEPSDVVMRTRAIKNVRGEESTTGQDPGTNWKIQNSNIGQVGSN